MYIRISMGIKISAIEHRQRYIRFKWIKIMEPEKKKINILQHNQMNNVL